LKRFTQFSIGTESHFLFLSITRNSSFCVDFGRYIERRSSAVNTREETLYYDNCVDYGHMLTIIYLIRFCMPTIHRSNSTSRWQVDIGLLISKHRSRDPLMATGQVLLWTCSCSGICTDSSYYTRLICTVLL